MKPAKLGILSALTASVCCLGPVVLVLLGLGGLGVGAVLGRYHWWFIIAAIAILAVAWRRYSKETLRCRAASCEMAQGNATRTGLTLASVVVAAFVGLNLYTYASPHRRRQDIMTHSSLASVVILVKGMTCFTCKLTVESSLERLPGVKDVDARVADETAVVQYDRAQVSVNQLIAAINKTGYRASRPE